ncbi:hypothetical protein GCM10011410_29170 [Hoyosella rhizosphaerae]|uniref:TPR repeat domain-containing protein n=2 Tax=Hoyosella rhizosphaerae TaxID=1755582 RepID=A0A916UJ66_9ACTN|nr:hypothetical protein GCM10011410_29170 [Hoyosella rhizosphaerae]
MGELQDGWDGIAFVAASDRAEEESAVTMRLAHAADDFSVLLSDAAQSISSLRGGIVYLRGLLNDAERLDCVIGEDWSVQPRSDVAGGEEVLAFARQLHETLYAIDDDDRRLAESIRALLPAVRANAGAGDGLTAQYGRELASLITDGGIADKDAARILRELQVAGLTPSQLEHLHTSGTVVSWPASTQRFVEAFLDEAGVDGVLALYEHYKQEDIANGTDNASVLANSILVLSDERVGTGMSDGVVTGAGSYTRLPEEFRELVSTRVGDGPDANGYFNEQQYFRKMNDFAGMLNSADEGYEPGREFGVELGRQSANLAYFFDHATGADSIGWREMVGGSAEDLLSTATRNTDVSYALITGEHADGTPIGDGYDADHTLKTLMRYQWSDDGAGAMTDMVSWIGETAGSDDPGERRLSQTAFTSLVDTTTAASRDRDDNNFMALLEIRGQTLGELNPEFTSALAVTASPYLNDLAGMPRVSSGSEYIDEGIGWGDAVRFATLVSTSDESAAIWAEAIYRQQDANAYAAGVLGDDVGAAATLGVHTENLGRLLDSGLNSEAGFREMRDGQAETRDTAWSNVSDTVKAGLGIAGKPGGFTVLALEAFELGYGSGDPDHPVFDREVFATREVDDGDRSDAMTRFTQMYFMAQGAELPAEAYPEALREYDGETVVGVRTLSEIGEQAAVGQLDLTAESGLLIEEMDDRGVKSRDYDSNVARGSVTRIERGQFFDLADGGIE